MEKCTGEEKHSHYIFDKDRVFYHAHNHTINKTEFNRLHHHAPVEHDLCSLEELENEVEILKVPF